MGDARALLGTYLRARRDALRPEDIGVPRASGRRVKGLRRQEVAEMAGISAEYYLRLEQGRDRQPSAQVLGALARALRLDPDECSYLFRLAGQSAPAENWRGAGAGSAEIRENVETVLMRWTHAPGFVFDRNQDVLAVNALGRSFVPFALEPGMNLLEAIVDGALAATTRTQQWDDLVRFDTAALRYYGEPGDPRLNELVTALSARSRVFREAWESHEARPRRSGVAPVLVEPFGYIDFRWQRFEVPGGGQFLTTFFGDPGSPAAAAIEYLSAKLALEAEGERGREPSREGGTAGTTTNGVSAA